MQIPLLKSIIRKDQNNNSVRRTSKENFVSDKEMKELNQFLPSIRKGLKDAKEGKYRIVKEIEKRKDANK